MGKIKSLVCKEDGCNNPVFQKGYCKSCYNKKRRHKKPGEEGYIKCSVEGCMNHACYSGKYCMRHYNQLRFHGHTYVNMYDKNRVIYYKDYAEIVLSDEKNTEIARTKVSLNRLPELLKYKWSLKDGKYARARDISRKDNIVMQRLLMNVLDDQVEVNYRNGDTLDNRDDNLRILSHKECARCSKVPNCNTSGVKGVGKHSTTGKWRAYISVNRKQINLGCCYEKKIYAIQARREGELKYFGFTVITDEILKEYS